jgi:hypothetical protein
VNFGKECGRAPDRDAFVLAVRMNVRHEPVW